MNNAPPGASVLRILHMIEGPLLRAADETYVFPTLSNVRRATRWTWGLPLKLGVKDSLR